VRIFFAGDTLGRIDDLYRRIGQVAEDLGPPDWVIHVGSFGIWPDPHRVDRSTRLHGSGNDFIRYYAEQRPVPFRTLFLPGAHEDHRWLHAMRKKGITEPLPQLYQLLSAHKRDIYSDAGNKLEIMGISGVYGPSSYHRERPKKVHHYTEKEVSHACTQGSVDLFLSAEAGRGAQLGKFQSQAQGINNVIFATRAKLHVHASYNMSMMYDHPSTEIRTLSLARQEIVVTEFTCGKFAEKHT